MTAPGSWEDVTGSIQTENCPITLARHDGVGAFQISSALYKSGRTPNASHDDLVAMLGDFAIARRLGQGTDEERFNGQAFGVAKSYHEGTDLIRVWYVSDSRNFLLITYVCDWSMRDRELSDCEQIVRSIRFDSLR